MASSYQDYHLILGSDYLQNTSFEMPLHQQQFGEMTSASSFLGHFYSLEANPQISATDARTYDSSSSLDNGSNAPSSDSHISRSPVQVEPPNDTIPKSQQGSVEKRRRDNDETSLITAQSKDTKESKSKKLHRKPSGGFKEKEEAKPQVDGLKASEPCAAPPAGFIHVRARRGQATDSHSLAERARREKISERMNILQGLVPGCDKITGKAHILDEIINYVQSLQKQVEFLAMKTASMSPMLYDFGMDLDDSMNQPEHIFPQKGMRSMPQPMASLGETNAFQPTVSDDGTNNYQMMNNSEAFLLPDQGPTSLSQDSSRFLMQALEKKEGIADRMEFSNMCSFQ